MLEILIVALGVLVIAVAIVMGLALRKPDSFSVTRSIEIATPALSIFPLIENFHEWIKWSPYEGRDAAMVRRYEGAASGTGAIYHWTGNAKVGAGRMEIVDVAEPSRVTIQLDFLKPFEGHNVTEFNLLPNGERTAVTWTMRGPAPFMSKVMQVFMNMDQMIGKDFATGLANLKAVAEQRH